MLEENKFSYRALLHGKDAEWYFARGLDDITAAGSYEVRLFHNDMESLGITTADCDKKHYVVAHLFVSESAATGKQQALRVVGQTLLFTICATNAVKAFTRTCEITPKGASWGSWVDLGAASTTDIQDGSITAQKLSSDIRPSVQSPLRSLFVTAGAEYNDTNVDKTRIAPWGETVIHKAGHYYLNGLGDITEEQMIEIYNQKDTIPRLWQGGFAESSETVRTYIPITKYRLYDYVADLKLDFAENMSNLESVVFNTLSNSANDFSTMIKISKSIRMFRNCKKLKYVSFINVSEMPSGAPIGFQSCVSLKYVNIIGLKISLSLCDSPLISKGSIKFMIETSLPSSAITITLHPEAYAHLADDADIVAALEAQPLVSLVSA